MSAVYSVSNAPDPVTLLRLFPNDWALWRSVRLQALAEAPQAFCSTLQEWQGSGDTEDRWRNRLASVPLNLLAQLRGEFVGMVGATEKTADGTVDLISLWVAPSARGLGVGDHLVSAVVGWATQQNASRVALDVREHNRRAMALYLRCGFVDLGPSAAEDSTSANPERRFMHPLDRESGSACA